MEERLITGHVEEVLFEERRSASGPAVGVITLNVEKTLNSLTLNMVELMLVKLREWRDRSDIGRSWRKPSDRHRRQFTSFAMCRTEYPTPEDAGQDQLG